MKPVDRDAARAIAPPSHRAIPVPQPLVLTPAPAPSPVSAPLVPAADPAPALPPAQVKSGLFSKAAQRLVAHLSPMGKAEAATLPGEPRPALASERWGIQLGAFHALAGAERAAQDAARLPVARGKPMQIVEPGRAGRDRLYHARLLNFTPREAQSACAQLRKKRIECAVISPSTPKIAAR